jgi:hypothetical protein
MPQNGVGIIVDFIGIRMKKMVGAAGFEPATCCSQSSRATRLRYTPPVAAWDTSFGSPQQHCP